MVSIFCLFSRVWLLVVLAQPHFNVAEMNGMSCYLCPGLNNKRQFKKWMLDVSHSKHACSVFFGSAPLGAQLNSSDS